MSQRYEKLKTLLKELFQLDQPDLDFGIYRVLHAKSSEVSQFLDRDLLPQVRAAFHQYKTADKAVLAKELSKMTTDIKAAGLNPDNSPKIKELRDQLKNEAVDIAALESEIYDHLFSFFRRYYSEGDFLAKRVYKPGVYAIPYEGEEVTLHWANKDQYYIKTGEYLRDYAFRLRPDDQDKPMRVHFRLADAAEGEHGNVKAAEGKGRVFVLVAPGDSGHDFIAEEDGDQGKELVIRFQYRPATLTDWPEEDCDGKKKPPVQKDLCALATRRILAATDAASAEWIVELGKPHVMASGERTAYSRLEAHLKRYTARNTFDYFIHKDLGTFLRRELDFYIKNEVMHLDDVENETAPRVEQYLSKIKVIRKIAGKIIDFLAQIEDFQKKLWLKKKFVIETQYCIAVGSIPEAFYAEIAANEGQRKEWVKLFGIDEIKGDLTTLGYRKKLKPEFLKANPTLVVDTRHFDANVKARLLDAIGDVNEQTDGVLFHSENSQALTLMRTRYRKQVKCTYIDPPYNTGNDGFVYRDNYQRSSWLTMVTQSSSVARALLQEGSSFFVSCDDNEVIRLREYLDILFGIKNFESQIIIQSNKRGQTYKSIAKTHEYLLVYDSDENTVLNGLPKDIEKGERDAVGRYELWELRNRNPKFGRFNRPNLFFPIYVSITEHQKKGYSRVSTELSTHFTEAVYPRNSTGVDSCWRWSMPKVSTASQKGDQILIGKQIRSGEWRIWEKSRKSVKAPKSIWTDTGVINERGTVELGELGLTEFGFPKPLELLRTVVQIGTNDTDIILDYFAGTGTSGHAIIERNRADETARMFILVEMGEHFDTVLLPRIKKVTFTPEWKNGKPKRLATLEEAARSPRVVKVVRLESYEDALNNLETRRTEKQQLLLDAAEAQGADGLREQYILRYMLDVETRGNQSLLNVQAFTDPTAYKLKVKRPGSDESREVDVDLLETFNWLIGLTVRQIATPQTFNAAFVRDSEKRLRLKGRLKGETPTAGEKAPYWFRTVAGTTPDGRRTLVIWRKLTGEPEQDNLVLDEWFTGQGYSAKDSEFDLIYVNGSNNLENLKTPDDLWKVRLIEEDFHRLMFEMERT